jgi:hypothetical protein
MELPGTPGSQVPSGEPVNPWAYQYQEPTTPGPVEAPPGPGNAPITLPPAVGWGAALIVVFGAAFKSDSPTWEDIQRHHAWPKYLGGDAKQDLVPLPRQLHEAFHAGLDKILPRQWGTAYYEGLPDDAKLQVRRDLASYTKAFDAKYGTQLYDALLNTGFEEP